jgi:predicted permease
MDRLRALPGVLGVEAVSGGTPLTGGWSSDSIKLPGADTLDDDIDIRHVTHGYLKMLGVPLRRGRYLTDADRSGSDRVVVINEAAANQYWPGLEAVGQRFTSSETEYRVVGVVGNLRHGGPEADVRREAYFPWAQYDYTFGADLLIRTEGDPMALLASAKAAVWQVRPEQRFNSRIVTLDGYFDQLVAERRFNMALLIVFGLLGLAISAAGIYGVIAYLVSQRTREFGMRMALGATRASVVALVVRRSLVLVVTGLVLGTGIALFLAGSVNAFLFRLDGGDPRIFGLAAVIMAGTGLLASALPARRASRVNPLTALRAD